MGEIPLFLFLICFLYMVYCSFKICCIPIFFDVYIPKVLLYGLIQTDLFYCYIKGDPEQIKDGYARAMLVSLFGISSMLPIGLMEETISVYFQSLYIKLAFVFQYLLFAYLIAKKSHTKATLYCEYLMNAMDSMFT